MKTSKLVGIGAALLVAVAASLVFGLGSRTGDGAGGPGAWTDVSPERLAGMLAEGDPCVVNVHVPYQGEIPGTDAFIPYDEIGARMSELPSDRGAEIVLYCRSGRMSTRGRSRPGGGGVHGRLPPRRRLRGLEDSGLRAPPARGRARGVTGPRLLRSECDALNRLLRHVV
ncbi:MAG: hypothetical protein KatS3mg014_1904 [Actinomycetota bacterium]|nr:MAG: hypothetical protein KatS3mg014_1904 [Actinomycetota bacterium]